MSATLSLRAPASKGVLRASARPSPKATRRKLVARWVQIWDELDALAEDIAAAPKGTFSQDERSEALAAIGHYAYIALVNKRPSMVRRRA